MHCRQWNGKPYYSLDCYLKQQFGEKLYKIAIDGGMTCPNRDGTKGRLGCSFCSEGGSGDFAVSRNIAYLLFRFMVRTFTLLSHIMQAL